MPNICTSEINIWTFEKKKKCEHNTRMMINFIILFYFFLLIFSFCFVHHLTITTDYSMHDSTKYDKYFCVLSKSLCRNVFVYYIYIQYMSDAYEVAITMTVIEILVIVNPFVFLIRRRFDWTGFDNQNIF